MIKKINILLYLLVFLNLHFIFGEGQEQKNTYIFIDISGSTVSKFQEMQNYAINEILPTIEKNSNLSIFKFYGKCVNIYDQAVKTDFDLEFAQDRISKLLPNGPWTNLDLVKTIIQKNIDLATAKVFILTDGHQELEDGSNEYYITNSNFDDYLEGCIFLQKNDWFILKNEYIELLPVIAIEDPIVPVDIVKIEEIRNKEKTSFKLSKTFFDNLIFCLLFLISFILLVDIITYNIWKNEKKKSEHLQQYTQHIRKWAKKFFVSALGFIAIVLFFVLSKSFIDFTLLILSIVSLGLLGMVSFFSGKNILMNIMCFRKIRSLYKKLTSEVYIDITNTFGINASVCNIVLFLKRQQIEDVDFEDENILEKQILLALALHKINESNAIGIQRSSKFYFINLETIFATFDSTIGIEERKELANRIATSYGNVTLDKFDWSLGTSIGILTGLIDIFFVNKPGDSKLGNMSDEISKKRAIKYAKRKGYKAKNKNKTDEDHEDKEFKSVIVWLENKYKVLYDKANLKEIGMHTTNHHLKSLAHSNDIIGLIFSILDTRASIEKSIENNGDLYSVLTCTFNKDDEDTLKFIEENKKNNLNQKKHALEVEQFSSSIIRITEPYTVLQGNKKGEIKKVDCFVEEATFRILYEKCKTADDNTKIFLCSWYGFVLWLGHLYSDCSGSSSAKGRGSGITAPFMELFSLNNVKIKIKNEEKNKQTEEDVIKKTISEITNELFKEGYDNRFYQAQKIPVLLNELCTKLIFILKDITINGRDSNKNTVSKILGFEGLKNGKVRFTTKTSNFELEKLLLLSYSVFSVTDIAGALVTSNAITPTGIVLNIDTLLSINYAGLKKLGKESFTVLLSYLRRWTTSPEKIIKEIELLAIQIAEDDQEED